MFVIAGKLAEVVGGLIRDETGEEQPRPGLEAFVERVAPLSTDGDGRAGARVEMDGEAVAVGVLRGFLCGAATFEEVLERFHEVADGDADGESGLAGVGCEALVQGAGAREALIDGDEGQHIVAAGVNEGAVMSGDDPLGIGGKAGKPGGEVPMRSGGGHRGDDLTHAIAVGDQDGEVRIGAGKVLKQVANALEVGVGAAGLLLKLLVAVTVDGCGFVGEGGELGPSDAGEDVAASQILAGLKQGGALVGRRVFQAAQPGVGRDAGDGGEAVAATAEALHQAHDIKLLAFGEAEAAHEFGVQFWGLFRVLPDGFAGAVERGLGDAGAAAGGAEIAEGLSAGQQAHDPSTGLLILLGGGERGPGGVELEDIVHLFVPNLFADEDARLGEGVAGERFPAGERGVAGGVGGLFRIARNLGKDDIGDIVGGRIRGRKDEGPAGPERLSRRAADLREELRAEPQVTGAPSGGDEVLDRTDRDGEQVSAHGVACLNPCSRAKVRKASRAEPALERFRSGEPG